MSEAYRQLAHQLRLIQTSVNTATDMAHQILRTEEQLFETHLAACLSAPDAPIGAYSRDFYRHIKAKLRLRHGYSPDEREIAAGLRQLGWQQHRVSRGMRWMPPSVPAP